VKLHLQGLDELGHTVYTIADVLMTSALRNHTCNLIVPNALNVLDSSTNNTLSFKYYARGLESYRDMIGQSHQIAVKGVYSSMSFDYSFNLKSVACSPGYMFQDTSCVCNDSIPGVLRLVMSV
jgi:hypothetical protein